MKSDNTNHSTTAPIATMSIIAPSLDSIPSKSPTQTKNNFADFTDANDKASEVKMKINSRSSSFSEDEPVIPDGGWGWVVVFATFVLALVADGITFSFGLLYVEFLKEFEASNSATSLIGGLLMAIPLVTGPIMSAFVDKFGCRAMTMIGGILSALGFIISSKCYSIKLMYLTFGVITGIGLGLIYVTIVVSVAFWFDKKRTLAVCIGHSGLGIGTFVFSPITTLLLNEFGWRGTTLVLAGCFLNMCVCGALMRDPDWIIEQEKEKSRTSNASLAIDIDELKSLLTSDKDAKMFLQNLETSLDDDEDKGKLKNYFHSVLNLPTFIRQKEKVPVEVLDLLSTNKNVCNIILKTYPSLVLCKGTSIENEMQQNGGGKSERLRSPSLHQDPVHQPLMRRQSSKGYHEKYFKNLKFDTHSLSARGVINTNKYKFKASSCPNIYRVSMVSKPKEREEKWYSEIVDLVKNMFDFSLFLELHFILLSLSTIILFVWFIVPYFYLAELMIKNGYTTEDASFTISNIGISSSVGLLVLGWAGDRPWMNIMKTYAFFLVLCGLSIGGLMLFVNNYIMLEICASLFGIALSSHFAFTPGIVLELVPLERFTLAYGLQLLCQGIGTLLGPPYAGLLFDVTGSWEQSFYQAAVWTMLSGIFIGLIPYTRNRKIIGKRNVEKPSKNTSEIIPIAILLGLMISLSAFVFYLTGISFS